MMHRNRLRNENARLAVNYMIVFCASVVTLGVITYANVERSIHGEVRERIVSEMSHLLGDFHDDGFEELRHDIEERIEGSLSTRLRYFVQNSEGRVVFDDVDQLPTAEGWHEVIADDGAELLLLVQPIDGGYILGVGADLAALRTTRLALQRSFGFAVFVMIVLGVLGSYVVSRRFVKRLEVLSQSAERIGNGDLNLRLPSDGYNDDFDQLATVINRMLDRIESLVGNVRRVSTNIAHDMRTPLGRIRQQLETLRDPARYRPEVVDELIELLDESLNTFSALLRIAELESTQRTRLFEEVALVEVLKNVVDAYQPVADDAGMRLRIDIASTTSIRGDAALLVQLFANVVENAIRHSGGRTITIEVLEADNRVHVEVLDDGVGVPAEDLPLLTESFFRVERSRSTPGSGLGLSLVAAIATLHDATLVVANADPGLRIVVAFQRSERCGGAL
jgi:signal transduction histidine kinase